MTQEQWVDSHHTNSCIVGGSKHLLQEINCINRKLTETVSIEDVGFFPHNRRREFTPQYGECFACRQINDILFYKINIFLKIINSS